MGAMVRHCVGINLARWSSFSSSSLLHSIFLMLGSSHSFQRALHCLGVLRASRDETRAHWFRPYLDTEALRISSSMLVQTPPLTTGMLGSSSDRTDLSEKVWTEREVACWWCLTRKM